MKLSFGLAAPKHYSKNHYHQPLMSFTAMTEATSFDQAVAAEKLTHLINKEKSADTAPVEVTKVDVSLSSGGDLLLTGQTQETLSITTSSANGLTPAETSQRAFKALAAIEPLADAVRFESNAQHAKSLRKEMEHFIERGADIPKSFLNWGEFDGEKAEQWNAVADHGVSGIGVFPKGVEFFIPVAENSKDQTATIAPYEQVQQNFDKRKDAIKETIAERLGIIEGAIEKKTHKVLDEQKWNEIQAKAKSLDINIVKEEEGPRFSDSRKKILKFTVSSPEQTEFMKTQNGGPNAAVDEAKVKELIDSNPLSHLSDIQRGKLLGRAFINGPDAQEIFPLVAGHKDMKTAIAKSLLRWAGDDAPKQAEVQKFITDDAFKDHQNWDKTSAERVAQGPLKFPPSVHTTPEGELVIELKIPAGKAKDIIRSIANIDIASESPGMAEQKRDAAAALTQAFNESSPIGAMEVQDIRTGYKSGHTKPHAHLVIAVKSDAIEKDPELARAALTDGLATLKPLAPYIKFDDAPQAEGAPHKEAPNIAQGTDAPYKKNVMVITIDLPGDDLPKVMQELAALKPKQAAEKPAGLAGVLAGILPRHPSHAKQAESEAIAAALAGVSGRAAG